MSLQAADNAAMLRAMLNQSHDLLLLVDPASQQIVEANATAENSLLFRREQLLGMRITDLATSMQDMFFWDEISSGQITEISAMASEWQRQDGAMLPIEMSIRMQQDKERTLAIVVAKDASSHKAVEDELAKMTSALRATLEATADGILVTDLRGNISNINHRFARIWQLAEELLNQHDDQQIFAFIESQLQQPESYHQRLDELFATPTADGFDTLTLTDGRVIERYTKPQYLGADVIGKVFSFSDVTARVKAEQDLLAAKNQAEQANRAKSEFLSQMSHELRTPLNAILGFAQILQEELSDEHREFTDHILKAGWHLLGLINEVLDLAKIEAGRLNVNIENFDILGVVRETLSLAAPIASKYGINVSDKTGTAPTSTIRADSTRVKQMVLNLVSNAIKYNRPNGQVTLTIEYPTTKMLRLVVTDTGIGMSEADLANLFQPFSRVGNKQNEVEGTGIGLAFTQKLAGLMQGDIGVSSVEGVGSSFWLDLPLAETAPKPAIAAAAAESAESSLPAGKSYTVLYIEDDPMSTYLMRSIFKTLPGTTLLTAPTPAQGLELAQAHNPDLIISDINLPGMTGLELRQQLAAHPCTAQTPVFALSANAMPEDINQGLRAGFQRYLTKPLNIRELTAAMREVLEGDTA
ncbi:MAG: ATP-binding protein [Chitinivorax sp.]|jgi:PAS domain S-box-containing protein